MGLHYWRPGFGAAEDEDLGVSEREAVCFGLAAVVDHGEEVESFRGDCAFEPFDGLCD
jgi:hypothetical protein